MYSASYLRIMIMIFVKEGFCFFSPQELKPVDMEAGFIASPCMVHVCSPVDLIYFYGKSAIKTVFESLAMSCFQL